MALKDDPHGAGAEALLYARTLACGAALGLLLLGLVLAVDLAGWMPPLVAPQRLQALWALPAAEFARASGMALGWGWLAQLGHGDVALLLGIVLLVGSTLPALLVLALCYARRGDWIYLGLCLVQLAVLLLVASGVLGGGSAR